MNLRRLMMICIGPWITLAGIAHADDLKVLSPVEFKGLLAKVGPVVEQSTGRKVVVTWGESGGIKSDIEHGATFDVTILTQAFIDTLGAAGKLDANTWMPIARSGIGIAIKKGAARPDVSTTEALKQTLLNATSVGFVEGSASSRYLPELFARLGIADAIKPKLKGLRGPAAPFVAKGDPEIAITQIAAILQFDGVELAGPLPPDVQRYTLFTAAASPGVDTGAAKALLRALAAPENAPALRSVGLDPPT